MYTCVGQQMQLLIHSINVYFIVMYLCSFGYENIPPHFHLCNSSLHGSGYYIPGSIWKANVFHTIYMGFVSDTKCGFSQWRCVKTMLWINI